MPIRHGHFAALIVAAAPAPHSGQCDDAQTCQGSGVGLLDAFGHPQRHRRITQPWAGSGRHVDTVLLPERRLVLDWFAVAEPWLVGTVLVTPGRAVDSQLRHQQAGYVAAG